MDREYKLVPEQEGKKRIKRANMFKGQKARENKVSGGGWRVAGGRARLFPPKRSVQWNNIGRGGVSPGSGCSPKAANKSLKHVKCHFQRNQA